VIGAISADDISIDLALYREAAISRNAPNCPKNVYWRLSRYSEKPKAFQCSRSATVR
jgi:hypothetical protein